MIYLLQYEGKKGFEQKLLAHYETEFVVGGIRRGWEKSVHHVVRYAVENTEQTWQLF